MTRETWDWLLRKLQIESELSEAAAEIHSMMWWSSIHLLWGLQGVVMTFQNVGLHGLPGGALVKHEPTKAGDAGDAGQSLDWHDALEKEFDALQDREALWAIRSWGGKELDMISQVSTQTHATKLNSAYSTNRACGGYSVWGLLCSTWAATIQLQPRKLWSSCWCRCWVICSSAEKSLTRGVLK